MISRTEKLARSLIALSLEYTDSEFEHALNIIDSGELLKNTSKAVKAAGQVKARRTRSSSRNISTKEPVEEVLSKLPPEERERSISFIKRILDPKSFSSLVSLRDYLLRNGISLPKKTPSRNELVKRVAVHLVMMNDVERKLFIEGADNVTRPESSLKRWSDLIVKDDTSSLKRP